MTFEELMKSLREGSYQPVYFLYGEESYYIDQVTDFITRNVLSEAEQSFNQTVLYGKDSDASQVIMLARRFPMMAPRQVVVVREAQDLDGFESLEHYMKEPQPTTMLVLSYKYKKPDKRKKIFKILMKDAVTFESKKLYENKVPGWISGYVTQKKYRVEPKAAALMAEFLGSNLSRIANEIDKLIVALGPENRLITPGDVERNIGISKDYNQFELQNALGRKDVVRANRIIRYFAGNPKDYHITQTIASLYFFFSKLLLLHTLKDKSQGNVAAALGVHPYFVRDYETAARHYSAAKVVAVISLLREYDMRSKGYGGSSASQGALLKEMIFKILHP